jgi:dienelactone hydrolase
MIRWFGALMILAGCTASGVTADEAPREIPFPEQRLTVPGAEGAPLRALLYLPPNPTRPAVIALHSCSGLGPAERPIRLPPHQRDWATRLLEAGHPVLFPDSFGAALGARAGAHSHRLVAWRLHHARRLGHGRTRRAECRHRALSRLRPGRGAAIRHRAAADAAGRRG